MRPCQTWQRAPEVGREESREITTPPPRRQRIGPKVPTYAWIRSVMSGGSQESGQRLGGEERTDVAPGVRRRTVARTQFIIEGSKVPNGGGFRLLCPLWGFT